MYSPLPKVEIVCYFVVCIYSMWNLLWNVYLSGNILVKYSTSPYLVPGWPVTNRLKDTSDDEWMAWRSYMVNAIPWLAFNVISYQSSRYFNLRASPLLLILSTTTFITMYVNLNVTLLFLLYGLAFYCSAFTKSTMCTWFVGIIMLLCNSSDVFGVKESLEYYQTLLVEVSFAWFILKGIDFSMSKVNFTNQLDLLLIFLGYAFYLPTFFFGPFIPFEDFHQGLQKTNVIDLSKCKQFLWNILKIFFWFLIIEISLHYIYCNVLLFHLNSSLFKNPWNLNGIGFCLAQLFYLKYLVYYSLGGSLARFDGINAPPPPQCVNRIHLYSNMWRYFDRGYYLFTVNCIYKPICQALPQFIGKKLLASIVCFSFVFVWHGLSKTIFYWSLFNFIAVTLEACGKLISCHPLYLQFIKLCGNPQNVRRCLCLLVTPLWIFSVISNYFFFAGQEYGFKLFEQFPKSSWRFYLVIIFIAYALCQISVEVEKRDSKKCSVKIEHCTKSHKIN